MPILSETLVEMGTQVALNILYRKLGHRIPCKECKCYLETLVFIDSYSVVQQLQAVSGCNTEAFSWRGWRRRGFVCHLQRSKGVLMGVGKYLLCREYKRSSNIL